MEDLQAPVSDLRISVAGQAVDLPPFNSKLEKPMMEMVAGSNVWYQVGTVGTCLW